MQLQLLTGCSGLCWKRRAPLLSCCSEKEICLISLLFEAICRGGWKRRSMYRPLSLLNAMCAGEKGWMCVYSTGSPIVAETCPSGCIHSVAVPMPLADGQQRGGYIVGGVPLPASSDVAVARQQDALQAGRRSGGHQWGEGVEKQTNQKRTREG